MKMLFVGNLNETLYSLSEYLMKDFQVQICSDNVDNVKDMIRLYRPLIIVYLLNEWNQDSEGICSIVSSKYNTIPFLAIGTTEFREAIGDALSKLTNKSIICRPVISSDIRKECFRLLNRDLEAQEILSNSTEKVNLKKQQILVVDDNALVLRNIKTLLEENNYSVVLANSGEKALEVAKKKSLDLILLDYNMPGMDGREVFETLSSQEQTKDIPVVFLTSVAERDQIYAVLKHSPAGYILKPPVNEKILSVIKDALE